ncbi:hypothetical protein [Limnohabitans sp. Rim28]|nr:hypothetical protein [Limnohabitans sp. Rim28]
MNPSGPLALGGVHAKHHLGLDPSLKAGSPVPYSGYGLVPWPD